MSTFPWDTHKILTIAVERPDATLHAFLTANDYVKVGSHGLFGDCFYIYRPAFPDISEIIERLHQRGSYLLNLHSNMTQETYLKNLIY